MYMCKVNIINRIYLKINDKITNETFYKLFTVAYRLSLPVMYDELHFLSAKTARITTELILLIVLSYLLM